MIIFLAYLASIVIMSLVAFVVYGKDKKKAKTNAPRTPEFTLLTVTALGGGIGALAGRFYFRHKLDPKRKFHFTGVNWVSLVLQLGTAVLLAVTLL